MFNFEKTKTVINDFTEMPVWQKAMIIAEKCFHISENLPRKVDSAITSQFRRSAESISANIAEGFGRRTSKDKSHFYTMSRGSACETKSHLIYGVLVKYFVESKYEEIKILIEDVINELNKIIDYLNRNS